MSVLFNSSRTTLQHVRIYAPGGADGSPPGAVSDVTASDVGPNSFKANYTPAAGATGHEYSLNGGPWLPMPSNGVITGLAGSTAYALQVRGVNDHGAGDASPSTSVTTIAAGADIGALPGTITNFAAVGITQTSATLSFNPDQNSTSYEMSRDGGPFEPVTIATVLSGLTLGTTYNLVVRGVNANGHGPETPLTFTTVGDKPADMGPVSVSDITATTARLSFSNPDRADYYEYWYGSNNSFNENVGWKRLPDDRIIHDLYPNTTGTYDGAGYLQVAVRAVNAQGKGAYDLSDPFLPAIAYPSKVSSVVVTDITETTVKVIYNSADYASGHQYTLGGNNWLPMPSNGVITLAKGTNYTIQVAGVNGWGLGPASDPVSFTTLLPLPGGVGVLTVSDLTDSTAKLNFSNATDATFYQYSPDDGTTWLALGADRVVRSLSANTSYVFRVRGGNATGYGPASSGVAASTAGAYATFNPARTGSGLTLSNNNLTVSGPTSSWKTTIATVGRVPTAGIIRYAEFRINHPNQRIMLGKEPYDVESIDEQVSFYPYGGQMYINGERFEMGAMGPPTEQSPVYIGMMWDGSRVWIYVNGFPKNSQGFSTTAVFGTPGSSATKVYPMVAFLSTNPVDTVVANFGASPWTYPPGGTISGWN